MCSIPLGEFQQILKQHLILNTQLWSVALLMYIYRLEDRIGKSYCTMLHGISSYFALPRSDRYEGPHAPHAPHAPQLYGFISQEYPFLSTPAMGFIQKRNT